MSAPLVGILMGSDSDWPKINACATALDEFGVSYEINVMSAHRTPHLVADYATSADERGLKVIIAAAGGAAHLAGVVAAHTTLPVIGLPVPTAELGGLDSLLATVQSLATFQLRPWRSEWVDHETREFSQRKSWLSRMPA